MTRRYLVIYENGPDNMSGFAPDVPGCASTGHSLDEMRDFIGCDSLAFLSVDGIYRAMGYERRDPIRPQFTDHCFTGDYPTSLTDVNGDSMRHQLSLLAEPA